MWPFKQIEGLRSFKLEEADESLLLSSNAVDTYSQNTSTKSLIPLPQADTFHNTTEGCINPKSFVITSSCLTTTPGQLLIADGYYKNPKDSKLSPVLNCLDFSQPIANNKLGENGSKSTSRDTLWYIYSYIYDVVTKSKLIFSNMLFLFLILILFMPTPITLNLLTGVVSPSPISRTRRTILPVTMPDFSTVIDWLFAFAPHHIHENRNVHTSLNNAYQEPMDDDDVRSFFTDGTCTTIKEDIVDLVRSVIIHSIDQECTVDAAVVVPLIGDLPLSVLVGNPRRRMPLQTAAGFTRALTS